MKILYFLFFLNLTSFSFAEEIEKPVKIHLFCYANGKGLQKDRDILIKELSDLNCVVEWFNGKSLKEISFADINIFVEEIDKNQLHSAHQNWFIPNPEWYTQHKSLLNHIDLILCRTKEVERIFTELGKICYFLSFTTKDHYSEKVRRSAFQYLHLAGSSAQKGTEAIKTAWQNNKKLPHLTIIKRPAKNIRLRNLKIINTFIDEKRLINLQNQCLVHLALSETEGFGHSLMEAMSVGAVVITTDAPPMNEFIQQQSCLVPYEKSRPQGLGINYYVNPKDIEKCMTELQKIPKNELIKMGEVNRKRYLKMTEEFRQNLKTLIANYVLQNNSKETMQEVD